MFCFHSLRENPKKEEWIQFKIEENLFSLNLSINIRVSSLLSLPRENAGAFARVFVAGVLILSGWRGMSQSQ